MVTDKTSILTSVRLSGERSARRLRACRCDRIALSHRSAAFIALTDARGFELLKIKGSALIAHLLKELFFVRLTPRNQITGDRDSISTVASVNSLLTATNCLFAASWHITNNVSAITAQHASIVRGCSVQPPQMCGRKYRSRAFDAL
jgi:hypothetical protein